MAHRRHLLTQVAVAELVLAILLVPLTVASAPVDATTSSTLDTDGVLDPPLSHGYTDFCPNLPRLTDTSTWVQFSFAAGALASTLDDLHAWGRADRVASVRPHFSTRMSGR